MVGVDIDLEFPFQYYEINVDLDYEKKCISSKKTVQ